MKLTKAEFKELADDIVNDLPENFSLLPPWTWLFLLEVMTMMFGCGLLFTGVFLSFFKVMPEAFVVSIVCGSASVSVPNLLLVFGKNVLGINLIRAACSIYILLSFVLLLFKPQINWFLVLSPIVASLIVLRITYMVRFQAFALYRYRMRAWERERMRKNAIFWQKIKEKRRQEKTNPRKSSRKRSL